MAKRLTLSEQLQNLQNRFTLEHETACNRVAVIEQLEDQVATKDRLIALQEEELRMLRTLPPQLAEAQKALASEKSTKDYYYRELQRKEKELEDVHTLLDVMPGSLPRKAADDAYRTYNATLRLTVFLVNYGKIAG